MNATRSSRRSTGWTGWIAFAAAMLLMIGFFNIVDGLAAIFADEVFVPGEGGVYVFDLTAWGWWTFLYGILLIATGWALFTGKNWARIVAIVVVGLNAISHMTFLPAYPLWSLIIIALDFLVLWALIVHGDEPVID